MERVWTYRQELRHGVAAIEVRRGDMVWDQPSAVMSFLNKTGQIEWEFHDANDFNNVTWVGTCKKQVVDMPMTVVVYAIPLIYEEDD